MSIKPCFYTKKDDILTLVLFISYNFHSWAGALFDKISTMFVKIILKCVKDIAFL